MVRINVAFMHSGFNFYTRIFALDRKESKKSKKKQKKPKKAKKNLQYRMEANLA
jgi:hypothetical protein